MNLWILIMAATGFASMIYELALAQLLTGLLGGSTLRFATTLGVYVVGMGLGSVVCQPRDHERDLSSLIRAEFGLFLIGLLAPFLFVFSYRISTAVLFVQLLTHSVIFVSGFCVGFEIPLISSFVERTREMGSARVLAADYIGMFAASLLFPFLLYPVFGLVASLALATLLNLLALLFAYRSSAARSLFGFSFLALCFAVNLAILVFTSSIESRLSELYAS